MFAVFKKLGWFFKEHWIRYSLSVIGIMTASALGLIPPKLIGFVVDQIRFQTITKEMIYLVIGGFLFVIITHYLVTYLWNTALFSGAVTLEKVMRHNLMRHFLKMSPTFYSRYRTGDLMARSTNDLKAISLTAGFGILTLTDATTFMFMIIAMMGFTISWKLTFAALIPLPIMGLLMNKYGAMIHERFLVAQSAFGTLNNRVLESIRGIRVSRAFTQEKQEAHQFAKMTQDVYEKNIAVAKIDALFEPTMKILVGLSYTIGLGYGAILVFQSAITLGDLVTFNVYLGMLIWPMFAVGELINILQRGNASLDRVHEILDIKPDIKDATDAVELNNFQRIVFNNVSFTYPTMTVPCLQNISFQVKRGETVGIVGKTGSGKTTLLKLLLRQYELREGDIYFDSINLKNISLQSLRDLLGYVPQEQMLFTQTIRENIQFGKKDATDEEIYCVLKQAHFLKDIQQLPNGLNTVVGESGVTLSGGQQQRVSLARAFIKNPSVLMLDDALSAVDGKTETHILQHIRKQRDEQTTFIVAHRLSAVEHADLIIVLDNGRVVEKGTHEQLMARKQWYYEQFKLQQMAHKAGDR